MTREEFLKTQGIEGTPEETERKARLLDLKTEGIGLSEFSKSIGLTVYDMALVNRRFAGVPWQKFEESN